MNTATPESSSTANSANNENTYLCQPQCPKSCSYPVTAVGIQIQMGTGNVILGSAFYDWKGDDYRITKM
jgi:hypothetical protein